MTARKRSRKGANTKPKRKPVRLWCYAAALSGVLLIALVLVLRQEPESPIQVSTPGKPQLASPWPLDTTPEEQLKLVMDEERSLARQLIQAFPKQEDPLMILGNLYSRRGDTDQAQTLWQQALAINPRRPEVYNSMAELAEQLARRAVALEPGAPAYLDLGLVYLAAGKRDKGLEALERALALDPKDLQIRRAYEIARKGGKTP